MNYLTISLKRKQIKALAALKRALDAYPGGCSLGQVQFYSDGSAELQIGCITPAAAKIVHAILRQDAFVLDLDDDAQ